VIRDQNKRGGEKEKKRTVHLKSPGKMGEECLKREVACPPRCKRKQKRDIIMPRSPFGNSILVACRKKE